MCCTPGLIRASRLRYKRAPAVFATSQPNRKQKRNKVNDRQTQTNSSKIALQPTAWRRFCRNRCAVTSLAVLSSLILVALITLPLSTRWYNVQSLDQGVRRPPALAPHVDKTPFALALRQNEPDAHADDATSNRADFGYEFTSWLGHDDLGRSVFYRIWPALLISLGIGLGAASMSIAIGATWGAVAALVGGKVDMLMMRFVDVLYGLPYILSVILLKIALTNPLTDLLGGQTRLAGVVILFIAIGGVSWLTMARVIRGQVLSLREEPFVEAAQASGASMGRILVRHMLPNLAGPIMVYATLVIPQAILQESFLSFLGIGVPAPIPSLGRLAADGVQAVNTFVGYWWLIAFPCGMLVLTLIALNFTVDGLRDAVDPRS